MSLPTGRDRWTEGGRRPPRCREALRRGWRRLRYGESHLTTCGDESLHVEMRKVEIEPQSRNNMGNAKHWFLKFLWTFISLQTKWYFSLWPILQSFLPVHYPILHQLYHQESVVQCFIEKYIIGIDGKDGNFSSCFSLSMPSQRCKWSLPGHWYNLITHLCPCVQSTWCPYVPDMGF